MFKFTSCKPLYIPCTVYYISTCGRSPYTYITIVFLGRLLQLCCQAFSVYFVNQIKDYAKVRGCLLVQAKHKCTPGTIYNSNVCSTVFQKFVIYELLGNTPLHGPGANPYPTRPAASSPSPPPPPSPHLKRCIKKGPLSLILVEIGNYYNLTILSPPNTFYWQGSLCHGN